MRTLAVAASVAAAAAVYLPTFDEWIAKIKPANYSSDAEYVKRAGIYESNMALVRAENARQSSYYLKATRFADLTLDEYVRTFVRPTPRNSSDVPPMAPQAKTLTPAMQEAVAGNRTGNPLYWDWCDVGGCNGVRDQGWNCAAGYAMATIEVAETTRYEQWGRAWMPMFSVQWIIDCSDVGCLGDLPMPDATWTIDQTGYYIAAADYPWIAGGVITPCSLPKPHASPNYGFDSFPTQNELVLETAVFQRAVAVLMNADSWAFQLYGGGVLEYNVCLPTLNNPQSLFLTGYSNDLSFGAIPYWRAMNSWGPDWGEDGFIRVRKGSTVPPMGVCGVQAWNMRVL